MKASLKNYRQAPRKVRLVADLVRGKSVPQALQALDFLPKKASLPVKKLILSAAANAKQKEGLEAADLAVGKIFVDKGFVFKRLMPRARGSAAMIRKKSSHVVVELKKREQNVKKTSGV